MGMVFKPRIWGGGTIWVWNISEKIARRYNVGVVQKPRICEKIQCVCETEARYLGGDAI